MRLTEIRIAGFGGQGVILAASIIGRAGTIYHGGYATMTQSFGPEARGGASSAQVVLSDEPILYPYVTRPEILVVMSQEAYGKFAPQLRNDGMLIVESDMVRVGRRPANVRVYAIPATRMAEELGKKMVLNVVMVGFFAAVTGLLDKQHYRNAIADAAPAQWKDLNLRAFENGYEYGLAGTGLHESLETEEVVATPESLG